MALYGVIIVFGSLLLLAPTSSWAQSIVAAVLPSSRSVQVGTPATAFATIINAGSVTATNCGISLATPIPATFSFQTTNPLTNQVTGSPNTPVDIPGGVAQSFVFALTPKSPINPIDVQFSFDCSNTDPAPVNTGLNTLLFSVSSTPVPDIVALAATLKNDGIVNVESTGVFAVATVNVGASGVITASADTGGAILPLVISLCETNPMTGQCVNPTMPTTGPVVTTINSNATPTFGIFVAGTGTVPFSPADNRVFVRFKDGSDITRGSTSVAVRTPPDIRGTYNGSGSLTQSSCQNPLNNGTFGFSASVNIPSQAGAMFSGTATLNTVISGINFVNNLNLSGTVTVEGQLSGTFTFTTFANGIFNASGNGTFTGSVVGNTVTLSFSGKILVGESCTISGNASGTP